MRTIVVISMSSDIVWPALNLVSLDCKFSCRNDCTRDDDVTE